MDESNCMMFARENLNEIVEPVSQQLSTEYDQPERLEKLQLIQRKLGQQSRPEPMIFRTWNINTCLRILRSKIGCKFDQDLLASIHQFMDVGVLLSFLTSSFKV